MGRRHRNRHGANGRNGNGGAIGAPAGDEALAPTYVTVRQSLWNAESDTPVLALEGLRPWEEIRGPALLLEDDQPDGTDAFIADSRDPQQLDLTQLAALAIEAAQAAQGILEGQDAQDAKERDELVAETPVLVLEQEADERATLQADGASPGVADNPELRPVLVLEPEPPVEVQAELPLVIALPERAEDPVDDAAAVVADAEPAADTEPAPPEAPPDPSELLYQEGRSASAAGRAEEARELYRRVLVERPSHIGARNNLALLLEASGDQRGALAEFDRALDADSENPTLLTNRGALLGAMGRYAAAERDLKKVLRIDPTHPEALFDIGVVMTKKGLWAEAVPQLRRAVELDPSKGPAYFYLGEALNHVDDLYGAMAAYQRASELMPSHPRALYGLGIVYDRLGRPDDAARMYRRSREVGRR
jgi:tetratricopeptide (TPR) repeat protein